MGAKGGFVEFIIPHLGLCNVFGGCGNGGWKRKCGSERLKGTI